MTTAKSGGGRPRRTHPKTRHGWDSGNDTLSLIRTSFPGRDAVVERAYRENSSFRDLCEDYRKCAAALHRWKKLQEDQAPPRWREYTELLVELGREIQTWLEAMDTDSPHPTGSEP